MRKVIEGEFVERGSSRATYKRCPKKWYWRYKLGLVPKALAFGATDLGTWVHDSKALWYQLLPQDRPRADLELVFKNRAQTALEWAKRDGAPEHELEKGDELALLGESMMRAYQTHYNSDTNIRILAVEQELEFRFPVTLHRTDGPIEAMVRHMLKPDAVYQAGNGDIWLLETKTTPSIRTEYLALDDQARPYGAMAERALRRADILSPQQSLRGVMYDFLRKAWPDEREKDSEGYSLNKDGSRSKTQPKPLFARHPVFMSRKAKAITLRRVHNELVILANLTDGIRNGEVDPMWIQKTTNKACTRCEFFKMCVTEDEGGDITDMMNSAYVRQNPYTYDESPETEERADFDMG